MLERIITRCAAGVLHRLGAAGIAEPHALLTRTLGQDQGGQDEQKRHLRRLFVSMVLEPVGIAVLQAYEQVENCTAGEVLRASVGSLIGTDAKAAARALSYLDDAAADAGAAGFDTAAVEIVADTRRIEPVVSACWDRCWPICARSCGAMIAMHCCCRGVRRACAWSPTWCWRRRRCRRIG